MIKQTGSTKAKNKKHVLQRSQMMVEDAWRFRLLWVFTGLLLSILSARAFYLHIINKEYLQKESDKKAIIERKIPAIRGTIYDRNQIPLAVSTEMKIIAIDPSNYWETLHIFDVAKNKPIKERNGIDKYVLQHIGNTNLDELAKVLDIDATTLKADMQKHKNERYLVLKKEVKPAEASKISAMHFQSLNISSSYKRYYPQAQPNAQIIGITNEYDAGKEGLEIQFDKQLSGEHGIERVLREKDKSVIKVLEIVKPVKYGENLTLSIDSRLQYIMYRELTAAGVANNARSVSAIAVDVKTGEILAMNSWPSFNPNEPSKLHNEDAKRNRGAIDSFEPGSTMKPFTVILGLQNKKINENSVINTSPGKMVVGGHSISDTHNYGALTPKGILVKSSNVGAARIALMFPHTTLPEFYRSLGFGQRTATGFLGESSGIMPRKNELGESKVATMAYGYGLNTTILQLAQGYAMIANHGVEVPLTIFKRTEPVQGKQMVSPQIADSVLLMLEAVTQKGGTAEQAVIPGYRVGGKTGTAHKIDANGQYSKTEYRALFAGVAPISNPRIAMVVVVENPRGKHYGGLVAAPVFAKIMQESLRLMNVPLDKTLDVAKTGE